MVVFSFVNMAAARKQDEKWGGLSMSETRFNYEPSELKKHNEHRDREIALHNYRKSNRYKQFLRDSPDESILYREPIETSSG